MEDPKPDKDMRPRFKKIEKVLQQAEDMAAKFVTVAAPRDLEHSTSLPVSRLLARVRLALAGLRLMQVCMCVYVCVCTCGLPACLCVCVCGPRLMQVGMCVCVVCLHVCLFVCVYVCVA